jgi:hypothetical protein
MYEIMTFLILIQLEILLPSIKANLRREAPNSLFPVSRIEKIQGQLIDL